MNGKEAEQHAEQYLIRQKLKLIERNYRCRMGEIDLIMLDQQTLVFIEVRKRSHRQFGGAAASVSYQKQAKIIKTAQIFLSQHPKYQHKICRFDVIAYEYDSAPDKPIWYKDAFTV